MIRLIMFALVIGIWGLQPQIVIAASYLTIAA